ncbi:carbon-nitrogen hydrolase family protein [Brachybacterium phenoliresistens]
MTADRARKKRVRARMARTGESYTAALRHLRSAEGDDVPTTDTTPAPSLRLAVAQTTLRTDPADAAAIRAGAREVLALMREARARGADLLQLPEATLCFPDKRLLSRSREEITDADWSRLAWDELDRAVAAIRSGARELSLRTVLGVQTRAAEAPRPRSSLLVIGPDGAIEAQYDERRLSRTKEAHLYERGHAQVTIDVDGIRLGLASGLEVLFGDVFLGYEDAGADAVLVSCQAPADADASYGLVISALAMARQHGLSIGWSASTASAAHAPSGVIGPDGRWAATCPEQERPAVVVHEIGARPEGGPRAWRRAMVAAD